MKVYHYTRIEHWADNQTRGNLMPTHHLGEGGCFPGIKDKKALFALLEPRPRSWVHNSNISHAWKDLDAHVGKMLVEITIDPSDEAMVVDQVWVFGLALVNLMGMIPEEYAPIREERYWDTRVPLAEYSARLHRFSLPEVIIMNPIPMERISISRRQPLIEDTIREATTSGKDYLARALLEQLHMGVPELQRWIPRCEASLEPQRSHRERF